MKYRLALFAVVVAVVVICSVGSAALRVSPEMELLAGVLAQTSWIESRGPQGPGNEYYRALKEFFSAYKDHEAVVIARRLTEKGFTYDAPPAFICHLGTLPELPVLYEYSDYLVERAGGRDKLEDFRLALADLAAASRFLDFFARWEPYLEECLQEIRESFREDVVQAWLTEFFGWEPAHFELIMAPSMFPGGGYGATAWDSAGNPLAFQIIREQGTSTGVPEFPTSADLELLTIHELGHSFVNPSLEAYPERTNKLRPLFWRVREVMRAQAYTATALFLNEQVIRAVEVLAARELYAFEVGEHVVEYNADRGFYLTTFVVEQLEHYRANRSLYPTFQDFVPHLFDQLEVYAEENCTWLERFLSQFVR